MGLSFKIAKAGKRYQPKPVETEENENDIPTTSYQSQEQDRETNQGDHAVVGNRGAHHSTYFSTSGLLLDVAELEVSFSINLFLNGFTVGKANEIIHDVPMNLCPYDRQAESIFCDIEHGCIPGDFFDDIPCKYINGAILCEIRDYRTSLKEGDNPSLQKSPKIERVVLRMGMENVIKDIPSIADGSWSYNNILEMEARVLKALRPVLQLSPKPMLDRFPETFPAKKLDLGISQERRKRRKLGGEFLQQQPLQSLAVSELHGKNNLDQPIEAENSVCRSTDGLRPLPSTSSGQPPRPSPRLRAKARSTQVQSKKVGQSCPKIKNELGIQEREALATSQVSVGLSESLAKEVPTATRRKQKSSVSNSSKNRAKSLANSSSPEVGMIMTSHTNGATATAVDPVFERFLKMKDIHERHGLNNRKRRDCWTTERRRLYGPTSLLASHLQEENRSSSHHGAGPSHSNFQDGYSRGVCDTRTLTFVRISRVFSQVSGNRIHCIEAEKRLIIRERHDEGRIEASVVSQHEVDICRWPVQTQTFRSRQHAKHFALQFISLMTSEGYVLVNEQIESVPLHTEQRSVSQQATVSRGAIPAAAASELLPFPSSISAHYPAQFRPPTGTNSPSTSNLFRDSSSPYGNMQYGLQLPGVSSLSTTQLDSRSQHWQQHVVDRRAHEQKQTMNMERIRQHLEQRKMVMGGSGLAASPNGPAQGGSVGVALGPGTAGVDSFDGQGRGLIRGSMIRETGGNLPTGQGAIAGLVNGRNMGQLLEMGSDQQPSNSSLRGQVRPGNVGVMRHESPESSSRAQRSDGRSNPNS